MWATGPAGAASEVVSETDCVCEALGADGCAAEVSVKVCVVGPPTVPGAVATARK